MLALDGAIWYFHAKAIAMNVVQNCSIMNAVDRQKIMSINKVPSLVLYYNNCMKSTEKWAFFDKKKTKETHFDQNDCTKFWICIEHLNLSSKNILQIQAWESCDMKAMSKATKIFNHT